MKEISRRLAIIARANNIYNYIKIQSSFPNKFWLYGAES